MSVEVESPSNLGGRPDRADDVKAKSLTSTIYLLQALSAIVVVTYLAAVMINYYKRDSVRGTWLESHYRWQIRTFWFSLLWGFVGFIGFFFLIGYFIFIANCIWVIYRVVRGWLNLLDEKEMYAKK